MSGTPRSSLAWPCSERVSGAGLWWKSTTRAESWIRFARTSEKPSDPFSRDHPPRTHRSKRPGLDLLGDRAPSFSRRTFQPEAASPAASVISNPSANNSSIGSCIWRRSPTVSADSQPRSRFLVLLACPKPFCSGRGLHGLGMRLASTGASQDEMPNAMSQNAMKGMSSA
jgi:hypothetical protein